MFGLVGLPTFTPADFEDNDTYGEDCTSELTIRGSSLSAVTLASVARNDGRVVGTNDYTVSAIAIIPGGLKFVWRGTGGVVNSTYYVKFRLVLSTGETLYRTVVVMTPAYVG